MAISPRTLKLLRLFGRLDLRRLGNVDVKDETKAELKKVMRALMDMQLGLRLKSQNFWIKWTSTIFDVRYRMRYYIYQFISF